jgi:ubiquinone/menaquinone biosynthesis C-methylase UbiE
VEDNNLKINKIRPKTSKGYKGIGMEGYIAKWYAKTRRNNLEEFKKLASRLVENVAEGSSLLELAPGPGYLAIEIAKLGNYKIVGLDISKMFVEIAQKKAGEAGVQIEFRQGNAADMPFDNDTFDFIVCSAAFKNFSEPVKALNEIYRVLKTGGKALIIDLRRDVSKDTIDKCVNNMVLNRIDSLVTKLTFKHMLIKRAYTKDEIREFVTKTSFRKCEVQEDPMDFEIWFEK